MFHGGCHHLDDLPECAYVYRNGNTQLSLDNLFGHRGGLRFVCGLLPVQSTCGKRPDSLCVPIYRHAHTLDFPGSSSGLDCRACLAELVCRYGISPACFGCLVRFLPYIRDGMFLSQENRLTVENSTVRIHSHCGYLLPDEFERLYRPRSVELGRLVS